VKPEIQCNLPKQQAKVQKVIKIKKHDIRCDKKVLFKPKRNTIAKWIRLPPTLLYSRVLTDQESACPKDDDNRNQDELLGCVAIVVRTNIKKSNSKW